MNIEKKSLHRHVGQKITSADKEEKHIIQAVQRCHTLIILERVITRQRQRLTGDRLSLFELAADLRRAELVTGKPFLKIPDAIWHLSLPPKNARG